MSNKINEEELEKLSNQQSIKARLLSDIGAVEAQKHELLHTFAEVVRESRKLNDKYGKITVNLEDGTYEKIIEENGQAD